MTQQIQKPVLKPLERKLETCPIVGDRKFYDNVQDPDPKNLNSEPDRYKLLGQANLLSEHGALLTGDLMKTVLLKKTLTGLSLTIKYKNMG